MTRSHASRSDTATATRSAATTAAPGKRTLVESVQLVAAAAPAAPAQVHAAAARGTATPAAELPFAQRIQRAFGRHDISGIRAHTGADATASAREMGAQAYATGDHVVLGDRADLHTVAHEAAHVVQQRGGVQLKGGVGAAGDSHEQHADQVADLVVQGKSAEGLLDRYAGGSGAADAGVQRQVWSQGQPLTWEQLLQAVGHLIQNRDAFNKLQQLWAEPTVYQLHEIAHALGQGMQQQGMPPQHQGMPPQQPMPQPIVHQPSPAQQLAAKIDGCWKNYNPPGLVERILFDLGKYGASVDQVQVTDSSGSVLTFVLANGPVVIQHYRSSQAFSNKLEYFQTLSKRGPKHVAKLVQIDAELCNLHVEKVQPLNGLFPVRGNTGLERAQSRVVAEQKLKIFVQRNWQKILHDCSLAVDELAELDLSQNDVRVDNVGITGNTDFVLFDFNMLSSSSQRTIRVDNKTMVESLTKHGCDDVPAVESHQELLDEMEDDDEDDGFTFKGLKINFSVD